MKNRVAWPKRVPKRKSIGAYPGDLHLNPSSQVPPVGVPLLIEDRDGRLVRCERRKWAKSYQDLLEFVTQDGTVIVCRPRWTYP